MISTFVQNYEDLGGVTNLLSVVTNLLRSRLPGGTIKAIHLFAGGTITGSAVFNIRIGGTAQFSGGNRPTIAAGTSSVSKTGLSIAVVRGDRVTLDLENNPHSSNLFPVTLMIDVDDGETNTVKTATYTTGSLANNAEESTGTIALAKSFVVLKVAADHASRARIYATAAYRTADAARSVGTLPIGEHGVIYDALLEAGNLTFDATGAPGGSNLEDARSNAIPISIQNRSGQTRPINITFTYLVLEN